MRVYPRDNKNGRVWCIDYSFNGRRVRKTVGTSKKMARAALVDTENRITKGKFLGITEPKKMLFDNLCEAYLSYA